MTVLRGSNRCIAGKIGCIPSDLCATNDGAIDARVDDMKYMSGKVYRERFFTCNVWHPPSRPATIRVKFVKFVIVLLFVFLSILCLKLSPPVDRRRRHLDRLASYGRPTWPHSHSSSRDW